MYATDHSDGGYESQRPIGPIDFLTGLQRFTEQFECFMLAKMK